MQVEIKYQLKCKRCGYEWNPRKQDVRLCPKCKSIYWDRERKPKTQKQKEAGIMRRQNG